MARLTMKALSEQLEKNNKTISDDNKLRFFLQHEQIMALRHDRDYLRESVSDLSQCLADQLKINDAIGARVDRMVDQINTLTQLAAQQAETIANLTGKLEELTEAYKDLADDEALLHQWNDRQQQRIVALEKRHEELPEIPHRRIELHGAWIAELFNRLNDHVNEE